MHLRDCIICGSGRFKIVYRDYQDKFLSFIYNGKNSVSQKVICKSCGLVFQNPVFTGKDLEKVYSADYGNISGYGSVSPTEKFIKEKSYRAEDQFKWIQLRTNLQRSDKSVLEVGCSAGLLLNLFKNADWEAEGLEPAGHFAEYARQRFSIKVHNNLLDGAHLLDRKYDLIIFSHVLEHTLEPIDTLILAASYLKKDGLLFVEIPNVKGIWRNMYDQFASVHIFLPSLRTMRLLIRKAGLEIHSEEPKGRIIRYLLKRPECSEDYSNGPGDRYALIFLRLKVQFLYSYLFGLWKKAARKDKGYYPI